jgi:hypothetical protein
MSRLAAASTIPVTNAAKQTNTRKSCRILIVAASPAPTKVAGASRMGQFASVLLPRNLCCCHAREAGAGSGREASLALRLKIDFCSCFVL